LFIVQPSLTLEHEDAENCYQIFSPAQSGSVAMSEHTLEALDSILGGQDFGAQSAPLVADDHIGPESMMIKCLNN
jgi:hypothetical protein